MENLLPSNHCAKQGLGSSNNIIPLNICFIWIILWSHIKKIINKLQKPNSIQLIFQQYPLQSAQVYLWWSILQLHFPPFIQQLLILKLILEYISKIAMASPMPIKFVGIIIIKLFIFILSALYHHKATQLLNYSNWTCIYCLLVCIFLWINK